MFDFPTILCCLNYANIYCLEIICLITTIALFPLTLIGLINIKWEFIEFFCQILFPVNLAIEIFNIFTIIFITLSTTSKRVMLNDYNKGFTQLALISSFIFLFLLCSFSLCTYFILKNYYKIKNGTYDFSKFNKIEIRKIKDFVNYKKNFVLIYVTNLIPLLFSLLNIFLWLSIYYRISFRIYCSFNSEIRKELKKVREKDKAKLEEETTNATDKKQNTKIEKVEISVVFEKDRHPSYKKNFINIKTNKDLFNLKKFEEFKEEFQTGISSSNREFSGNNKKFDVLNKT